MNEERIEEKIQREEGTLLADSGFAAVRRYSRDLENSVRKGPEPEIPQAVRTNEYLRAAEDAVEQNDNNLDGVINNLPEEAIGSVSGMAEKLKEDEKKSVLEEIRRQAAFITPPTVSEGKVPGLEREGSVF